MQIKKPIYSFEVFPPKSTSPVESVEKPFARLSALQPDFISVTFGAGGGTSGGILSCKLASRLQSDYNIKPVLHLPCLSYSKDEIKEIVEECHQRGIVEILALRGDRTLDRPAKDDFVYASDLILYLKELDPSLHIMGACYPETHPEAVSTKSDLLHLKEKVDCGAEHLISQLFFDNELFYDFLERCDLMGINVPIEAGIMPVVNEAQIHRMVSLCGASLPRKFTVMMQRFSGNPDAIRDAGIAYAVDQIVDLVANGVDGIHLYTMNNPYVAERITQAVSGILGR